jgi:hypothetical protein
MDCVLETFLEALREREWDVMREQGLAFRLDKNGHAWDYSYHLVDIERWMLKIKAEEPDAVVSVDVVSMEEWYEWRTGERWSE